MVEVTQEDRGAAIKALNEAERQRSFGGNGTVLSNVCQIIARHRIAAEQRAKLEGARLALEAAAKDAEEWFPFDTSKRYPSFGVVASIRALDPAKIVGEGR